MLSTDNSDNNSDDDGVNDDDNNNFTSATINGKTVKVAAEAAATAVL